MAMVVSGRIVGTVLIRFALFPLVILGQRNAAQLHNHMPTMTRLQQRMSAARRAGDLHGCLYISVLLFLDIAHCLHLYMSSAVRMFEILNRIE